MALTEDTIVDVIEVLANGQLQVRVANRFYRDGDFISEAYHRFVVSPGDDLSGQSSRVGAIGQVIHTPAVIKAFKASQVIN
jgi:hypothetical protein